MGKQTLSIFILLLGALSLTQIHAVEKSHVKPITAPEVFKLAETSKAKLTLVNFWASWCAPCRHEFPDLLKFKSEWSKKGVALEFVSVDFPGDLTDVKDFLNDKHVNFTTYIKTGDDEKFIEGIDKTWKAGLPTTFVLNSKGKILHRFEGPVILPVLETKVSTLLKELK